MKHVSKAFQDEDLCVSGFPRRPTLQKLLWYTLPLTKTRWHHTPALSELLLPSDKWWKCRRKRPKSRIWRQNPHTQFVGWMNVCCVFPSRRDGGRERTMTQNVATWGPRREHRDSWGTQPLGLGQVAELDNKKQGKSPGWFLNPKAMQPNSHAKADLQSTLSLPEPTALTWHWSSIQRADVSESWHWMWKMECTLVPFSFVGI